MIICDSGDWSDRQMEPGTGSGGGLGGQKRQCGFVQFVHTCGEADDICSRSMVCIRVIHSKGGQNGYDSQGNRRGALDEG